MRMSQTWHCLDYFSLRNFNFLSLILSTICLSGKIIDFLSPQNLRFCLYIIITVKERKDFEKRVLKL